MLRNYISDYPNDNNVGAVQQMLSDLDNILWDAVKDEYDAAWYNQYKTLFPQGQYIQQCLQMLDDLPWIETKKIDTIDAYKAYMRDYPGKHDKECNNRISELTDDSDWQYAEQSGRTPDLQTYIEKHPNGKHKAQAEQMIANNKTHDDFIAALKKDRNAQNALAIQQAVVNNIVSYEELESEGIFTKAECEAINGYREPQMGNWQRQNSLPGEYTQVYFWGVKRTGKTCLIAALLSYLSKEKQNLNFNNITGANTFANSLIRKMNFSDGSISALPPTSESFQLPAMTFTFKDNRGREHRFLIMDLAGEIYSGVYKQENGYQITEEEQNVLNQVKSYLNDNNDKIHFFVWEYGAMEKLVPELEQFGIEATQIEVHDALRNFFQEIFTDKSVGVYVVVTKSDKADKDAEEKGIQRNEQVKSWVTSGALGNLKENLKEDVKKANIDVSEWPVISFSLGEVFAVNFAHMDKTDIDKIVELMMQGTNPVRKKGIFS